MQTECLVFKEFLEKYRIESKTPAHCDLFSKCSSVNLFIKQNTLSINLWLLAENAQRKKDYGSMEIEYNQKRYFSTVI